MLRRNLMIINISYNKSSLDPVEAWLIVVRTSYDTHMITKTMVPEEDKEAFEKKRESLNQACYKIFNKLTRIEDQNIPYNSELLSPETRQAIAFLQAEFPNILFFNLKKAFSERDKERKLQALSPYAQKKVELEEKNLPEVWPGEGKWGLFFTSENMRMIKEFFNGGKLRSIKEVSMIIYREASPVSCSKIRSVYESAFFNKVFEKRAIPNLKKLMTADKCFFDSMPEDIKLFHEEFKKICPDLISFGRAQQFLAQEKTSHLKDNGAR
jgi:hypothetical protein